MTRRIRRPTRIPHADEHQPVGGRVRDITVGSGLPPVEELADELEGYMDVLMGRVMPEQDFGHLTLMEYADIFYARACEIQFSIQRLEREGGVFKGHSYYRFRTGELRAFQELTKRAAELGSRRLTQARLIHDMAREAEGLFLDE